MHFLGIEISHAGSRALVLDLDANAVRAESWEPHAWIEGLPAGSREQDPGQWIIAVDRAVRRALAETPGRQIAAIGVAGPARALVALDEADRIVRPVKMAGDTSVKHQAEEIARAFGGTPGLIELAGQVPGTESAAAECLWLRQHEPYHFQRAARFLTTQDFIAYWLTGERATEPGSASATGLLDIRTREWCGELLDFIDPGLLMRLPPLRPADAIRGTLRPALARAWGMDGTAQVGAGSGQAMLAALAAGCVANGTVAVELGSRGVIYGAGDAPVIDYRGEIQALCGASGNWLGHASSANTAVAPEVLRRHYGWSPEQYEAMVSGVPAGADGLLLLPYFTGESIPRLPDGCGVLHGMTPDNFTPAHVARATAEGAALGIGYAMGRLRELGFDPPEVRLLGAGADSPVTRAIMADVLGAPVVPVSSRQGAALGAAMQAVVAFFRECGEPLGFAEVASYLVAGDAASRHETDARNHDIYQEMISRQQYLVDTLHPAGFI